MWHKHCQMEKDIYISQYKSQKEICFRFCEFIRVRTGDLSMRNPCISSLYKIRLITQNRWIDSFVTEFRTYRYLAFVCMTKAFDHNTARTIDGISSIMQCSGDFCVILACFGWCSVLINQFSLKILETSGEWITDIVTLPTKFMCQWICRLFI